MINYEIEMILSWSTICALADMTVKVAGSNNDPTAIAAATRLEFQIIDRKLYVTLSTENDKKHLRTVKWNKYRSQRLFKVTITT